MEIIRHLLHMLCQLSLVGHVRYHIHVLFRSAFSFFFSLFFSVLLSKYRIQKSFWNGKNPITVALSAAGCRLSVMSDTMSYSEPLFSFFLFIFIFFSVFKIISIQKFVFNGNNRHLSLCRSCRIPYEWSPLWALPRLARKHGINECNNIMYFDSISFCQAYRSMMSKNIHWIHITGWTEMVLVEEWHSKPSFHTDISSGKKSCSR